MNLRSLLDTQVAKLREIEGVRVVELRVSGPLDQRELAELEAASVHVPDELGALMADMNGVELLWTSPHASGSLNILPLREMVLGWTLEGRTELLDGVLWDSSFPAEMLQRFKSLRLFEPIAGDSGAIAFDPDRPSEALLTEGERITPMVPPLADVAMLLIHYLGCHGVREALTEKDWRERVAAMPCTAMLGRAP